MKKKTLIVLVVAVLVVAAGWMVWCRTASTTRIALVNFQQFQTASIVKSNTDRFVRYVEVAPEDFGRLGRYDLVLGFGMGMRITADERAQIQRAADRGTPVLIYASTNPENNISNLDSLRRSAVESYLGSGNRRNYENLARYVRKEIDRKRFFVGEPEPPVESVSDVLFHLDDEVWFTDVAEYEAYLRERGFWNEGGARVALMGGMNDPFSGNRANVDSMIVSFQRAGMNIYPVSSMMRRMDFLRAIEPDAVVYFAHGRLAMGQADAAVEWLKERNIPIFTPLSILTTREEWEADPMGMFGGFMSQSLVVPELDGAIYPYVVNVQVVDEDGLSLFAAMPDRLGDFTRIVGNFVSLKRKANADKRLAIYYFKGAGQETLTAQGLETVPSLYNLLKRLRAEGYRVDGLPATVAEFERLLMAQGAVLNTYAEGAFDDYLRTGKPALIERSDYESWVEQRLPAELYREVTDLYGDAPGGYMSVRKDGQEYLAVARIELGNIALLPQPMAALGDDAFAIVHGAKSAPPHTYIGAYLWAEYAFGADAMMHFGTHGSLEFTPQKQVALGSRDWPDRLVGTVPHFYYYTIGNLGESIIAKRRSYATLVSYLTPPFMESGVRGQYKALTDRIREYWSAVEDDRAVASLAVKKTAVAMGLHRELRMDSLVVNPWSQDEIERVENFAEELASEKMTGQLYTAGVPYDAARIRSSVMAMSADPIAYSLAALDRQRGRVTAEQLKNKPYFTRTYLEPAKAIVERALAGGKISLADITGLTDADLARAKAIVSARPRPTALRQPAVEKEEK
ncbi:cobaltochelatase subunit CobN, partial [Alistipes sp. OttesenSCG-928-B03]|nr:cobaltochelatase subunit CobN [Alistipes sp. OttesenSCG-928-B03]